MNPAGRRQRGPHGSNTDALRASLVSAFRQSLRSLDPSRLVRDFLLAHPITPPSVVIAVGKAAPAMARGSLDVFGPTRGLVVTTDGTHCPAFPDVIDVVRAAHPVPDVRSIRAADHALRLAASAQQGHLLVLVSGGTSSLLCAPAKGLALEQKQAVTHALLSNGVSIKQVNTVRRHLSRIKGGQLALAASADVTCLVISDVIGGAAYDVGSGPACADPTTREDARRVLHDALPPAVATRVEDKLVETLSPHVATARGMREVLLAGPEALAEGMGSHLERAGFRATIDTIEEIDLEALANRLISHARVLTPASAAVVAAEPTVVLPRSSGTGGRAGWIALRVSAELPDGVALLAAASDGVDGSSGGGGACVGSEQAADVGDALARFDDARVHRRWGTQLDGTPTGVNMTDVYVVARA